MYLLRLSLGVLFHPVDTFKLIKADRSNFSYIPAIILLLMVSVSRIVYIFTMHYPIASIDPADASFFLEIAVILVPLITWVVASFGITSIIEGESMMRETFTAATFCMMPFIITQIPLSFMSHIMTQNELDIFNMISSTIWIWVFILIFVSVKVMNSYTMLQTTAVVFISLLGMLLTWAICLLVYALTSQFWLFIVGLYKELKFIILMN